MKNTLKYFGLFALALTTAVSCYKEDAKIGEAVRIAVTPEPVQLTAEGKTPEGKNFQAVVFLMQLWLRTSIGISLSAVPLTQRSKRP